MKVLQLIDSLEVGGAERVAVNIANALSTKIDQSYLCATRAEGLLKGNLSDNVKYLFLNKKSTFDLKSILKFNNYIKTEGIDIVHAHSSSFFVASLIKVFNRNLKVVWHDHYGNSEFLQDRNFKVLKVCSRYFNHIFSVNKHLEVWAKMNLNAKNVSFLANFAVKTKVISETILLGEQGKRIICLANLREQKDHITLLEAFKMVAKKHGDWSLHLVGKDSNDLYSESVKSFVLNENLQNNVFIYGSKPDTFHILMQSTIGVLSSKSEGLPIALLEYGLAGLPVIAARVGECSEILTKGKGLLVSAKNSNELAVAIFKYIENETLRNENSIAYHEYIRNNFSEASQMDKILKIYKNIALQIE